MKNITESLRTRRLKRPPLIIYPLLGYVWKLMFQKKLNVHYIVKADPRKCREPHIIVSNHASRLDYIYTGLPLLPKRYNYIAGYNEFFRSHLAGIFRLLQIIPKRNFVPDIYTIVEIKRLLKKGSSIVLFPEGMSSISGGNQPSALGTGKLLKHLGVPVFSMVIRGGYMTNTKYNLEERPGYVEVEIDRLYDKKILSHMTEDEIQQGVDKAIHHDDFSWNKTHHHYYDGHGRLAEKIGDLLYLCPRCHKEFTIEGKGNRILCASCGPLADISPTYELTPLGESCALPESISAWHRMQRLMIQKEIADPSFTMRADVKLGVLSDTEYLKDQATSTIVGEGIIKLDHHGFKYEGTKDDRSFSFAIPPQDLPTYGMCTDISRFYTFFDQRFYEFYPSKNIVMKWFLATEELHRLHGGTWSDFLLKK